MKNERYCPVCGLKIIKPKTTQKYHFECAPTKNKMLWAKNNPKKVKAEQLARNHKYKTEIIYECKCIAEKKFFHHYDYNYPHLVLLLCRDCHLAEHRRLRRLSHKTQKAVDIELVMHTFNYRKLRDD